MTEAEPLPSHRPTADPPDRSEGTAAALDRAAADPDRAATDPDRPGSEMDRAAADDDGAVVERAEALAAALLADAEIRRSRREKSQSARLARVLAHPEGRSLILALTDEVLRIRDPERAAAVLRGLARDDIRQTGLGNLDLTALTAGAYIGSALPWAVIPAVRRRVRSEMSGVILPASPAGWPGMWTNGAGRESG